MSVAEVRVVRRGEMWWAALPPPSGSGPGYRRPVLIIQTNEFNRSHLRTVLAVVITSNVRLAQAPGNVLLSQQETGLAKDSVANVSQIITLDKEFLGECVGTLPGGLLRKVEAGIRLILGV